MGPFENKVNKSEKFDQVLLDINCGFFLIKEYF